MRKRIVRCPLCGHPIDATRRECRSGCPMGKQCTLLCCPRCRYSFPIPESKTIEFFKRLFSKGSPR